jgi:hypothetical protein
MKPNVMFSILACAGLFMAGALLSGCASPVRQTIAVAQPPCAPRNDPSLPYACNRDHCNAQLCAQALKERQSASPPPVVDENPWDVKCATGQVTAARSCMLSRFGKPINSDGNPYGRATIPFAVSFIGASGQAGALPHGPFIMAGFHTFPGRHPVIRVDDHEPIWLKDDAGVSAPVPEPAAVEEMRRGKVLKIHYITWPSHAGHDAVYDLDGFEAAWQRLLQMKDGR